MFAPLADLAESKPALQSVYELVCTGLNNANPGDDTWTPERVKKELDQVTVGWLQDQILAFSGLRVVKDSAAGESSAAALAS